MHYKVFVCAPRGKAFPNSNETLDSQRRGFEDSEWWCRRYGQRPQVNQLRGIVMREMAHIWE